MASTANIAGFFDFLWPRASPRLRALYQSAVDNAGLLRTDFYTIRDLLDLSGYAAEEPLHVLLLCLMLGLDEGSLCVEASESGLARRLTELVGASEAHAFAQEASSAVATCSRLIGQSVSDGKPLILHRHGPRTYLYFQKYLKHEQLLQAQLRLRLAEPTVPTDGRPLRSALDTVLNTEPMLHNGRLLQLNSDQRLALALALLRNFTIISGGPGTGKTSIVFTLLRCLVRCGIAGERIALAAPTGRAAQRLTDALRSGLEHLPGPLAEHSPDRSLHQLTAATLHHLLGYHPTRGTFRHHAENPLAADVVIVDEVSMVGLVHMAQLLQATAPQTKLILLGDKDQLPSVEAGAVLANLVPADGKPGYSSSLREAVTALFPDLDLLPSPPTPLPQGARGARAQPLPDVLVILEQNYRSQREILEVAGAINRQQTEVVDRLRYIDLSSAAVFADLDQQPGCGLLDQDGIRPPHWRHILECWLEHQFLAPSAAETYRSLVETCILTDNEEIDREQHAMLDRLFTILGRSRILTLVREGPFGCVGINQYMDQMLRLRLDRRARGSLFLGAPVLVTRNDYGRQLFNGDVGIALRNRSGAYRVVFQRQGGYVSLLGEALPAHELAFALTVHKSQGSEYGQVLLVLPPEGGHRLMTKEMIYTGITRAKHLVVICAKKDVLRLAIGRRVERESALLDFDPV